MSDSQQKKLAFDLKLKEIPVDITDVNGKARTFKLKELTGGQRDNYLDSMNKRMTYKAGEVESVKDLKGIQTSLLCLCLYNDEAKQIQAPVLSNYPAMVLTELFKAAQELSGLVEDEEKDAEKNAQVESDSAGSS